MSVSLTRPNQLQIRKFFLLLGLSLFVYLIYRLKPSVLYHHLQKVGFNFIYILLITFAAYLVYTFAWEIFLKNLDNRVRFGEIFKIKVSGEAINSLTPFNWGGGDPVRMLMLKKHIPITEGAASVVVDRTLNVLATVLFLLMGVMVVFAKVPLPTPLKIGLPILICLMVGTSIFLYWRSREGLLEFFIDLLKKLHLKKKFSEKTLTHALEIDRHISEFYKMNKNRFIAAWGLHFFGKCIGIIEIYFAARFVGNPISLTGAVLLLSVTVLVNIVFVFIPGSLGVTEGAFAGTFALLGFNPAIGTSIQIIRRVRMIFWTALGFLFLASMKGKTQSQSKVVTT